MVVYVANPLYDAVFKYLMEDNRIAKTFLSALLKKKFIDVKIRRNEYANLTRRESISMFRIDFAATVLDEDNQPHLMLIELQKTWLPTETLRFRRYLALQYNNEENMRKEEHGKYAIPMVAIDTLIMQLNELKEKDEMLRKMIKGMQENGMSLDKIAKMLNKTVEEVKQIL